MAEPIASRSDITGRDGSGLDVLSGRLENTGRELHSAFQAVVDEVPVNKQSPQELARILKVHRTLAGRLLTALRLDDPLAATNRMPRSEGLRIFLNAARGSTSRETIRRAESALREFEELVHGELGGWDGLEAVISEWLPEAREKLELANKQLAFKGMSHIIGARAETQLITSVYYPAEDGKSCDAAAIDGLVGLQRLRPRVKIPFASVGLNPHDPHPITGQVEGVFRDEHDRLSPLLETFCSKPLPVIETLPTGDTVTFVIAGQAIGANSTADVFSACAVRQARPLYSPKDEARRRAANAVGINVPAQTLVMNVLLHRDVWPDADPELIVYDTHLHGPASPNDPARDVDRIDVIETIQSLGHGVERFRATEVGQHVEMIQYVCGKLGWNPANLRGYRCRVRYPLFNAQYCMVFDPPPAPE